MNIFDDRRLGRFLIPLPLINDHPLFVREALNGVIVVKAYVREFPEDVEYIGICDAFSVVKVGDQIPTYKAVMRRETDGIFSLVKWELGTDWDFYQDRRLLA